MHAVIRMEVGVCVAHFYHAFFSNGQQTRASYDVLLRVRFPSGTPHVELEEFNLSVPQVRNDLYLLGYKLSGYPVRVPNIATTRFLISQNHSLHFET
jgi:hypothetical protein